MRSARRSAVRLLQLMLVASIVLPLMLFFFAGWVNYRNERSIADERIERSLDILHEHTLKVFQTVERSIAEVNEIVRGMPDEEIREQQPRLHERIKRIVEDLPQLRAIFLIDRDARPLLSSQFVQVPSDFGSRERSFFSVHMAGDVGTYVSEVVEPRLQAFGTPFFVLSRRRPSVNGTFNGVVAIAVVPQYFEEFYALIGRSPGSFYALIRADGRFLARFPEQPQRMRTLGPGSGLETAIAQGWERAMYTIRSQVDGTERRIGYRKLEGFPIYVIAGLETSAVRAEWAATMASHLIFGLPATLFILLIIAIALRRTRRLYEEADRREAAEGALRQAQRLEAIGHLTGGVAHDFNNLLMIVSGSAERLRRDLTSEKHRRLIDMIMNATSRGESLTRQLLAFSRRQTLTPQVIDLSKRLPELKDMLNRSLRDDIRTEVMVPDASCAVKVDPSEFEIAMLNLAVNARDAMPKGGALGITIEPVTLKGEAMEEGLIGGFIAIRVADTGCGIAADILPHVFEPYFTTKEVGKGTGLGLSQVYGFAKQSGGTATITSTVGRGTMITLYLPRTYELPASSTARTEPRAAPRRAGTVLVVEDSPEVAEVATVYFQQLGYMIKQVPNANEALKLIDADANIDLIFSDIVMPGGMDGVELGHAIRRRYPAIPVLLATGYSESARDAVQQGFVVLQKPFDLLALEQAVREARKWKVEPAPGLAG
ncbi:MAG TPA: ATP-binding protein [Xanthobacteraceae bacterium]|nr:ATP-binding protein [Xanthobacteraceae bacterium]